jgi:transcriptional regulator with GAF, ATPase, and Fis domain
LPVAAANRGTIVEVGQHGALPTSTEVLATGGHVRLRTRALRIEVVAGVGAGQVATLPGPEVRIGSGRDVDMVLLDPAVSRHHLTLRADAHGLRVVDAGSRNGTVLDGMRIIDAYARQDSVIVVGNSSLRLRVLADVIELPLSSRERFGGMLGKSIAMRRLFTVLERVAPSDDTVLVEGETGTGKELVAEAIHEESERAANAFVVFDCSAVASNLIESELFGHVRGAFTGALADRMGAFEAADGGTLFLDEIGELPLDLQPKLLRALERFEVRPVGSNTVRRIDVRIVAATNRNLPEECARGRFREDLWYRLAVVRVSLPPLRERVDDIPLLAQHFAHALNRSGGVDHVLTAETLQGLASRAWPGNVRELRNAVARILRFGAADTGGPAPVMLPGPSIDFNVPLMVARDRIAAEFEEAYLREALRRADGNATLASEIAGVNRKFMQRAIKRYGLRED